MLRMVASDVNGQRTLHLEGRVIGPWVDELGRVAASMLSPGGRLTLDLAGVSFVGREGVRLLCRLCEEQVVLLNCSRFVAEQLKALTESAT